MKTQKTPPAKFALAGSVKIRYNKYTSRASCLCGEQNSLPVALVGNGRLFFNPYRTNVLLFIIALIYKMLSIISTKSYNIFTKQVG
jgi:hypothetical protein